MCIPAPDRGQASRSAEIFIDAVKKSVVCPDRLISYKVPVVDRFVLGAAKHEPDDLSEPGIRVVTIVPSSTLDPLRESSEQVPIGALIASN